MPDTTNAQPAVTQTAPSTASPQAPEAAVATPQAEQLSPADIKAKNELRKEMQRVTDARTAFQKEREAFAKEREEWRQREALLAVDPDAYLKPKLGEKWYETLTKAKLGDDSNLAVQQLRQEWEARERTRLEAEAAKRAEEEQRLAAEKEQADEEAKQALEEYRSESTSFVKEKATDYQVISALGLEHAVAEKTQSHYQQTKKLLSHKEAADLLEQELDKAVEKVLSTPKWQEKLGKPSAPKYSAPVFDGKPKVSPSTIDNGMRAGVVQNGQPRLTKEQKLARAMAKLAEWEAEKAKAAQ